MREKWKRLCAGSTLSQSFSRTKVHLKSPIIKMLFGSRTLLCELVVGIRCESAEVSETSEFIKPELDRKSTRLNSSHVAISYAVFCLKKKKICTTLCAKR